MEIHLLETELFDADRQKKCDEDYSHLRYFVNAPKLSLNAIEENNRCLF